jgi:acyl-CoA thioesterase
MRHGAQFGGYQSRQGQVTPFTSLLSGIRGAGNSYHAEIPEDWLQGRTTFGGLTAALCLAAVQRAVPDLPPLRSAQFTFVGPAGGAVEVTPRLLRRGKSSVFAAVELQASGSLATHAILSFGAARASQYSYRARPMPAVPPPGTTEAFFRSGKPKFTQHFETFIAGGHRMVSGAATPEILIWLRHRDPGAMATLPGLIALGDTPPVAAYTMLNTPVPASSITWSIELIDPAAALRAPGDAWYLLRSAGEDVREGYSVQDMSLWAQDGTLILLARQTVAIFG